MPLFSKRCAELVLLAAAACAPPPAPSSPTPSEPPQPAARSDAPSRPEAHATPAEPAAVAPTSAEPDTAVEASAEATGDPTDAGPEIHIRIEEPYKLEHRPPPASQEEYKRDILDRRHWNGGGMGELLAEPPGVEGHPDPRVIVNLERVDGPHDADELERLARRNHWMKVVRCYRLGAFEDPYLRGWTRATIRVSASGTVRAPRMVNTELDDDAVARCMVDELRKLELPEASGESRVEVAMRVGPGDEPMPPPEDLIVPGDGELSREAMRAGVEAGLPAIEDCYRAAFAYAPGLWGRLILRFHVTKYGTLDEAFQINRRFPDERVSQCVEHAAREFSFARPEGGDIRFVVPLRLSTDHARTEK